MPVDPDDDLLGLDPEALARAEAALDALSSRYLTWAEADLESLRAALTEHSTARLFTIAHDMKGQAATFGYPLVTAIGERLCRYVDAHPEDADPARLTAMVEAIAQVLTQRLDGDGGATGREVLAQLDA